MHFMGMFVWLTFPLAAVMLAIQLLPLPASVHTPAQRVVDSILYLPVQAFGLTITLFHLVLLVAGLVYLSKWAALQGAHTHISAPFFHEDVWRTTAERDRGEGELGTRTAVAMAYHRHLLPARVTFCNNGKPLASQVRTSHTFKHNHWMTRAASTTTSC